MRLLKNGLNIIIIDKIHMTEDFFDTVRYDYSIDQKLEEWMASRVKLAFSLAKVQQGILEGLGYKNLAPLSVANDRIWFYIKE